MIDKISFGNTARYVNEGTIFAKEEAEKVAEKVAKSIKNNDTLKFLDEVLTPAYNGFKRPDAPIVIPKLVDEAAKSYGISHGIPQESKTLAVV